jgi:hypothetical protein
MNNSFSSKPRRQPHRNRLRDLASIKVSTPNLARF